MVSAGYDEYPLCDRAWPLWETGAPAGARVGGEWNSDSLRECSRVYHQLPLGRNAAVNAECENNPANHLGILPAYALGQRFYTPYNYPIPHLNTATQRLDDLTRPWPAHVYRQLLTEPDLAEAAARTPTITTGLLGNTPLTVAHPASSEHPGILDFTLHAPADGFEGLYVELTGRAKDFAGHHPGICIKILAGPDEHSLQLLHTFSDAAHIGPEDAVDLSPVARRATQLLVRLELHAPNLPPELLSWASLSNIRFTLPWPPSITAGLHSTPETLQSARTHNLLVSWRRDAELALTQSPSPAAQQAYTQGHYATAYHLAIHPRPNSP